MLIIFHGKLKRTKIVDGLMTDEDALFFILTYDLDLNTIVSDIVINM